jgi:GEVED domain/HYR domain/SprB repeat
MKIIRTQLITLTAFFVFNFISIQKNLACGFDYVGSCATSIRFSINTLPKDYFASTCAYGNAYGGSLGTGLTNLQITNASTVTWESCTNTVLKSNMFYRVYKDATAKGSFQSLALTQLSTLNSPPYRTKTYSDNFSVDLLTGLLPNTIYTLEIYYQVSVDTNGDGITDVTGMRDNGGTFYAATFQTGSIVVASGFPVSVATQNVSCKSGTNGTATATASGGRAPYTYAWSNAATGAAITGLSAGSYTVTATDALNAKGIFSFNITEPNAINAGLTTANPSCAQSNGSISSTPNGGTPPYTYKWNNNATTASLTSLAAGAYSITVTDSKNCTGTAAATLTENCGNPGSYCTSASAAPWGEWIAGVQLNTLNNVSEKSRADRYAVGYSDWTDKSTNLSGGQSYPLSISPGLSWSGQQTNLFFRVWIDFNKNGIFDDTEKVFEKTSVSAVVSGSVLVPASALAGNTAMRVSMKKDAYATSCEAFAAGEVEDYSIIIGSGSPGACTNDIVAPVFIGCPQNISLNTTGTSAIATWTPPTATDNCTASPTITSTNTSGQSFPIGNTVVTYTAKDAANNAATCSFTVSVTKQVVGSCKKYTVTNTNDVCVQTWKPYGMKLTVSNVVQYLVADQVVFENSDTTATLKGTFRTSAWSPVQVNITFKGGTTTPPVGSPQTSACSGSGSGYTYFTNMTGTVNNNGVNLTIARRGSAFQIGVGANLEDISELGGAGQFTLSDNTLGQFGFKMATSTTACGVFPLKSNQITVLDLNARENAGVKELSWVNNSSYKNDYFEIQRSSETGDFKTLDFVNEKYFDNSLHSYTFKDVENTEGVQFYRIKAYLNDGTIQFSQIKEINSVNLKEVTTFPNPTNDVVFISLKSYVGKDVKLEIYNTLGVFEKAFELNSVNESPYKLMLDDIHSGQHFIRIIVKGKRDMIKPIVILRE